MIQAENGHLLSLKSMNLEIRVVNAFNIYQMSGADIDTQKQIIEELNKENELIRYELVVSDYEEQKKKHQELSRQSNKKFDGGLLRDAIRDRSI